MPRVERILPRSVRPTPHPEQPPRRGDESRAADVEVASGDDGVVGQYGVSNPPKATAIVFSGGLSVAEWETQSSSSFSSISGSPTVESTRGPDMGGGVGGLLYTSRSESASASVSSSRTLRYNLSNGRGDIVAQADSDATLTWTASYEAYGKRTKETGENLDKQRGNSKDEDPTGLLNEGFRYRDLETGVWLSRDPAGFVDGPNLYAYVRQNPWSKWDPNGLYSMGEFFSDVGAAAEWTGKAWDSANEAVAQSVVAIGEAVCSPVQTAHKVLDAAIEEIDLINSSIEGYEISINEGSFGDNLGKALNQGLQEGVENLQDPEKFGATWGNTATGVLTAEFGGNALKKFGKAGPDAPNVPKGGAEAPTIACFTAGTLVASSDGPLKIETLRVGDRVLTTDDENQRHETEVDPLTWKKVTLAMINEECTWDVLELEVIRSPEWMQQTACREGGRIWFVLEEMGLEGWSTVKCIEPCPTVKPGPGRVVLSTLTHYNGDVYELRLAGSSEILEPTGRHRLFSVTRNDWVRAETLSEGEQLKTHDGVRSIASIGHRAGIHRVYNIEVETEHCYYVGPQQVLSHNVNPCAAKKPLDSSYTSDDLDGLRVIEGKAQGRDWRLEKLETYEFDPKQPSHIRGWLKNERRRTDQGRQDGPRNPPGYEQAHKPGKPAREGFDYNSSDLNLKANNDLATAHGL